MINERQTICSKNFYFGYGESQWNPMSWIPLIYLNDNVVKYLQLEFRSFHYLVLVDGFTFICVPASTINLYPEV